MEKIIIRKIHLKAHATGGDALNAQEKDDMEEYLGDLQSIISLVANCKHVTSTTVSAVQRLEYKDPAMLHSLSSYVGDTCDMVQRYLQVALIAAREILTDRTPDDGQETEDNDDKDDDYGSR